MLLYSPSANAFFDPALHQAMPEDATQRVSRSRHAALMAAQADGSVITSDARGRPVAKRTRPVAAALPTNAEVAAAVRAEAQRRILAVSPLWRQLNDIRNPSDAGAARFVQIDALRSVCRVIERDVAETAATALPDFPVADHPLWPDPTQQES
jgi:hypothetical protein